MSQDWSPNSLTKLSVYLCKVLSWFPGGQRVQTLPHPQRGPTPHTPALPPCFILAPFSSRPLRCQVTQEVSREKNSDIFSLLKGSSPSYRAAVPTSDKGPSLLWPTRSSDFPESPALISSAAQSYLSLHGALNLCLLPFLPATGDNIFLEPGTYLGLSEQLRDGYVLFLLSPPQATRKN